LRTEDNIEKDSTQSIISGSMQKEKKNKEEQREIQLEKKRERSRSSRTNEAEEQRQIRLEKERERSRSSRTNEAEEQRQIRLEKKREQNKSSRTNETEKQRQVRLEELQKRNRSSRTNETEEQGQIRLEQQRRRSQTNRANKKLGKQAYENIDTEQENTEMRLPIRSHWPEPIPRDLKETCLQQFLQQMSMSALAEATCAACNIRTSAKDSKNIPISKIPNIHLLKVSEELKDFIKNSSGGNEIFADDININMIEHVKSSI
jgi:hypothetical protein